MEPTCSMEQPEFLCSGCDQRQVRLDAALMRVSALERISECFRRKLIVVTRTVDGVQRRKRASVSYALPGLNGELQVCCKSCFVSKLKLTERQVKNAVQCATDGGVFRYRSMQGHRQTQNSRLDHKVKVQCTQFIKSHTNRIASCKLRRHRHLKPNLDMNKLWKLYVQTHCKGSRVETKVTFSHHLRAIAIDRTLQLNIECPMCPEVKQHIQNPTLPTDESHLIVKHRAGIGRFVVTAKPIKKGEFVVEYRGETITSKQLKERNKQYNSCGAYGSFCLEFRNNSRVYCVDATAETEYVGRLVSHSCKTPNLKPHVVTENGKHHVVLVATKDIAANQILNFDYGVTDPKIIKHHPWLKD